MTTIRERYSAVKPRWAERRAAKKSNPDFVQGIPDHNVEEWDLTETELRAYNQLGYHIFWLPNPPISVSGKNAKNTDSFQFRYVFVDFDFKGNSKYQNKGEARRALSDFTVKPTMIVDSGNGIHAYWRVSDLDLDSYLELQFRLIQHLGTDEKVANIKQQMRMPGYDNTKVYGAPVPCEVLEKNERQCLVHDLRAVLPEVSVENKAKIHQRIAAHEAGAKVAKTKHVKKTNTITELPPLLQHLRDKIDADSEASALFNNPGDDRSAADMKLAHRLRRIGLSRNEVELTLNYTQKGGERIGTSYAIDIARKVFESQAPEIDFQSKVTLSSKYRFVDVSERKKESEEKLENFLNSADAGIFHFSDPIGLGKTQSTIEVLVQRAECGEKFIYVAPTNAKAREIEADFRQAIGNRDVSMTRIFGIPAIPEESAGARDLIKKCVVPDDVMDETIRQRQSVFRSHCRACRSREKCPYFRVSSSARNEDFGILITNQGHLGTDAFWGMRDRLPDPFASAETVSTDIDAGRQFKLANRVLVIDEDGYDRLVTKTTLPSAAIPWMIANLWRLSEIDELPDFLVQFRSNATRLPFRDGVVMSGRRDHLILSLKGANVDPVDGWRPSGEVRRDVERFLQFFSVADCVVVSIDRNSELVTISVAPNVLKYFRKVIILDATAANRELVAQFGGQHYQPAPKGLGFAFTKPLDDAQFALSYRPEADGVVKMCDGAELIQVLSYIAPSKMHPDGSLDAAYVKSALMGIKKICDEHQIDRPFLIPDMATAKNAAFRKLAKEAGFETRTDVYQGKVRGLNSLKDRNVVVIGGMWPTDAAAAHGKVRTRADVNPTTSQDPPFLVSVGGELRELPQSQTGSLEYAKKMKDRGREGRQTLLRNIVQAIRSRIYYFPTKVVVFCPFPLTEFGLYCTRIVTRYEFEAMLGRSDNKNPKAVELEYLRKHVGKAGPDVKKLVEALKEIYRRDVPLAGNDDAEKLKNYIRKLSRRKDFKSSGINLGQKSGRLVVKNRE